jgi:hypothetical protein
MRAISVALLVTTALLAAGCGGGGDSSDSATPEDVASTAASALGKGELQKVCDQLNGAARRELVIGLRRGVQGLPKIKSTNCLTGITQVYAALPEAIRKILSQGRVDKATITGDTAKVRISSTTLRTELRKSDGAWLISGGFFEN